MIPEIIRQIDNNAELTAAFQKLTEEAYDEQELAEAVQEWFERTYEDNVALEPLWDLNGTRYGDALHLIFESILQQAIESITEEQWLAIAKHLWERYWTQKTADRMGFPN